MSCERKSPSESNEARTKCTPCSREMLGTSGSDHCMLAGVISTSETRSHYSLMQVVFSTLLQAAFRSALCFSFAERWLLAVCQATFFMLWFFFSKSHIPCFTDVILCLQSRLVALQTSSSSLTHASVRQFISLLTLDFAALWCHGFTCNSIV